MLPPERRCSVHDQAAARRRAVTGGAAAARPGRAARRAARAGPAAWPPPAPARPSRRAAASTIWGRRGPVGVDPAQVGRRAGPGRRSSTSPITSIPEPRTHSIHSSVTSSAHGERRRRQRHLGHVGALRPWSGAPRARGSAGGTPPRAARPGAAARLSRRSTCVSAAPIETFSRSLSSGAQAGSMPNAVQKRSQSRSPRRAGLRHRHHVDPLGGKPLPQRPSTSGRSNPRRTTAAFRWPLCTCLR